MPVLPGFYAAKIVAGRPFSGTPASCLAPRISRGSGGADLGGRLDAASISATISHHEQAARIGIGRSTNFEVAGVLTGPVTK
ncbi:MAG: hypothetical protein ACLQU1_22120 [Bryobacteraceae bacterium]